MNKDKTIKWITAGALFCSLYVALGAFGAHGLKNTLEPASLKTYNTGLHYLVIHALGLILINLTYLITNTYKKAPNLLIIVGLILFSLSLIIHSLKDLIGLETTFFARLAPIGGLSYMAAWISFTFSLIKLKK